MVTSILFDRFSHFFLLPFQAFVNGKYQGAATKTAKLCSFSHSTITEYSNYRCGTPGIYVLSMAGMYILLLLAHLSRRALPTIISSNFRCVHCVGWYFSLIFKS